MSIQPNSLLESTLPHQDQAQTPSRIWELNTHDLALLCLKIERKSNRLFEKLQNLTSPVGRLELNATLATSDLNRKISDREIAAKAARICYGLFQSTLNSLNQDYLHRDISPVKEILESLPPIDPIDSPVDLNAPIEGLEDPSPVIIEELDEEAVDNDELNNLETNINRDGLFTKISCAEHNNMHYLIEINSLNRKALDHTRTIRDCQVKMGWLDRDMQEIARIGSAYQQADRLIHEEVERVGNIRRGLQPAIADIQRGAYRVKSTNSKPKTSFIRSALIGVGVFFYTLLAACQKIYSLIKSKLRSLVNLSQ